MYRPSGFEEDCKYAAVVVVHPAGGVKEQTSRLYAGTFSEGGLVATVFDASYQGESMGEPRHVENPYVRVEDVSAVIDCLFTLPFVDESRIGIASICAGGGHAINAAVNDRRVKAAGTISGVNFGLMYRQG